MHPPPTAPTPAPPTPLSAVLLFSFLNSLGTTVVTSGIYFFTAFSTLENFALGVLLGLTYIGAAIGAQPLVHWLEARHDRLGPRAVLGWMMGALAVLCSLPWAAERFAPSLHTAAIWTLVGIYSPLTGILWPVVESYLSGGRRGDVLRRATGVWNVVWSCAGVLAFLLVSPITKSHPNEAILALGLVHGAAGAVLYRFHREPGEHVTEGHEPHPPVYETLLKTFRVLLPTSYIVLSALMPYLPTALGELHVNDRWHTALASAWMAARVAGFFVFHRWAGWHGRWWPVIAGGGLVLTGFALCVMGPRLGGMASDAAGIGATLAGLAMFGIGHSIIYSAAIYYALEVGQAEVQAGGAHEALIGSGYTLGPLVGLGAAVAQRQGWLPHEWFNGAILAAVGLIGVTAAVVVLRRVLVHVGRAGRLGPEGSGRAG